MFWWGLGLFGELDVASVLVVVDEFEGDGYKRMAVVAELSSGKRVQAQIYALRENSNEQGGS